MDAAMEVDGSLVASAGSTSTTTSSQQQPSTSQVQQTDVQTQQDVRQPLTADERADYERLQALFADLRLGDVEEMSGSGESPSLAAFRSAA